MSAYPSSIKSFTAKTDFIDDVLAAHVNDIQNEVMAIETELGTLPKGSAADVKARIEAVESRLADLETGWIADGATWTYASATTFTVSGDVQARFPKGTKIKLTQSSTVKYFYAIGTSYGGGVTTVTITGGSDYTLANAAITANYRSYQAAPQGFPQRFNFTPVWTNLTVGNGANTGVFSIDNNALTFQASFTFGSTSSIGTAPFMTAPVLNGGLNGIIGFAELRDTGTANYVGITVINANNIYPQLQNASGTYLTYSNLTATTPHTWAATDIININGVYLI